VDVTYFDIEGVCLLAPKMLRDTRGFFRETYRADTFNEAVKDEVSFVQENHALSKKAGIIRGLHYQSPPHAQGKLVSCIAGAVMDIIVDVRSGSKTYGEYLSVELTAEKAQQLWIPAGFLHGYVSLKDNSEFLYKVTSYYNKSAEGAVLWNDADLAIDWGFDLSHVVVSEKDAQAVPFKDFTSPF